MTVLNKDEYDKSYFDGKLVKNPKRGGYFDYSLHEHSQSEILSFLASIIASFTENKKVLELGCAKGFIVDILRKSGVQAYGIDISSYAIDNSPSSVKKYLEVADTRVDLKKYKDKQWYLVYSIRNMECLDPSEIPSVVKQLNRISVNQIHIITEPDKTDDGNYTYMNLNEWLKYDFNKGTKIISYQTKKIVTK